MQFPDPETRVSREPHPRSLVSLKPQKFTGPFRGGVPSRSGVLTVVVVVFRCMCRGTRPPVPDEATDPDFGGGRSGVTYSDFFFVPYLTVHSRPPGVRKEFPDCPFFSLRSVVEETKILTTCTVNGTKFWKSPRGKGSSFLYSRRGPEGSGTGGVRQVDRRLWVT